MTDLVTRLQDQAAQCRENGSPLTGALLEGAAEDLAAGGIVADLMAPHLDDPPGSVPSLRLAGGLHRLVLERKAPELALHYPSVGGTGSVEGVWPAAERAIRDNLDELRAQLRRTVQTNEVGRSAALYGALLMVGGPVRLLEIGSSGGLNLRCDAFAYELEDQVLGDPASPVRLVRPWVGPHPEGAVEIVERKGCDPNPIDTSTTDGRLTLTSFVWGDQVARLERLRGAFALADALPATVERLGALEFLTRELDDLPSGVTTVVWHSVVWQYIDPQERKAVDALVDRVGGRTSRRLVRISMEPDQLSGGDYRFRVHVQAWPGGQQVHVADCMGHGPPVRWTGARP
ncbi:MAG: hypothetical protein JWO12_3607 [Frankiales bacterium]|nr:hypothetical protein [Frankiales bacterium]